MSVAAGLRDAIAEQDWARQPLRDPENGDDYVALLRALYETGRRDLPLGRLLEGHVDAVQIVQRYGSAVQVERLRQALCDVAMVCVLNGAVPGEPRAGRGGGGGVRQFLVLGWRI